MESLGYSSEIGPALLEGGGGVSTSDAGRLAGPAPGRPAPANETRLSRGWGGGLPRASAGHCAAGGSFGWRGWAQGTVIGGRPAGGAGDPSVFMPEGGEKTCWKTHPVQAQMTDNLEPESEAGERCRQLGTSGILFILCKECTRNDNSGSNSLYEYTVCNASALRQG